MNSPKRQLVIVRFDTRSSTAADTFAKSAIKGSTNEDLCWSFDRHSLLEPSNQDRESGSRIRIANQDRGEWQISSTSEVWVNNARLASSQAGSVQVLCGNRFDHHPSAGAVSLIRLPAVCGIRNPANATLTKVDGPARYRSGSFLQFDRRIRRIRLKHAPSRGLA
jgi:hypothetical protein